MRKGSCDHLYICDQKLSSSALMMELPNSGCCHTYSFTLNRVCEWHCISTGSFSLNSIYWDLTYTASSKMDYWYWILRYHLNLVSFPSANGTKFHSTSLVPNLVTGLEGENLLRRSREFVSSVNPSTQNKMLQFVLKLPPRKLAPSPLGVFFRTFGVVQTTSLEL